MDKLVNLSPQMEAGGFKESLFPANPRAKRPLNGKLIGSEIHLTINASFEEEHKFKMATNLPLLIGMLISFLPIGKTRLSWSYHLWLPFSKL